MVEPNLLETFQLELRELASTALAVKSLRLPDAPVFTPVKVAADLASALAPLEPLITKALDAWEKSQEPLVGSFAPAALAELAGKGEDDNGVFKVRRGEI